MISIFIATSGRPAMFRDMLDSLHETTFGYDVETVAVIDADPEARMIAYDMGVDWVVYNDERTGALNAWNTAFRVCSENTEIYVPTGDDHIFRKDWLKYALESFEEKLDCYGVLGMNDLAYNGNTQVSTMFLFDRDYCKNVMGGIFAPPCYKYYCVDLEWNEKAKMLGRFYWEPRSIVEHAHSAHGKRPVDATDGYKEEAWMFTDNAMYQARKNMGFPVDWESII